MSSESNERLARLGSITKKIFPKVMQTILKECISPRGLKVKYQLKNIPTIFTESEISLMEKLPNLDNFSTELCFKILRFEKLLHEPSCKWGNVPYDTEVEIGDDVQRILNANNDVISRKSEEISELYYEEFQNRTQQVLKRVDAYLCQDTCLQLYQTIHNSDINITDMLQELTLMQKVNDSTINLPSLDMKRCAKCSMVVMDVFPMIMQELMTQTGTPAKTLHNAIMRNVPFKRKLNKLELDMVDTLMTDEYTKIDVSLSYKIIVNFFQLFIPPPSRQWGANPIHTEIGIGEDIERIRWERNRFVHRVNNYISESLFDNFFVTFIEVGERIDAYLNKPPNNGYAHDVEKYKTCVLHLETEKKLLDAVADLEQLKEKYRFDVGNPRKEIHIFVGKSTEAEIEKNYSRRRYSTAGNLHTQNIWFCNENRERIFRLCLSGVIVTASKGESYTKLKIYIHEVDDSREVVKLINSLKEDLNSENIKFKGAENGSILLYIDVKNRVVLDDGLFKSEVNIFFQKLFKFCNLTCHFHSQTYAVIASATDEFEEPTINMQDKGTGKCLMGDKGHVVVCFEVKNKIFHSPDTLNRNLNEVFETLVLKGNGKNMFGKTDVYAELIKSENMPTKDEQYAKALSSTEENMPTMDEKYAKALSSPEESIPTTAFNKGQIPVKSNLPVSINLREQLNTKNLTNENQSTTSCFKTGTTLVLNDCKNDRLIICNVKDTDIRYIPLPFTPHYMTQIHSDTVAVSCGDNPILITNISTYSVTSKINNSGTCLGISYNDINLFVGINYNILHMMDLTGNVIRIIPLPSDIRDITVDRDRLLCTDDTSIYCCSLYGKLIWKFKRDNIQDLGRITTDNERNVYVTNYKTNTVVVISDDGQHHKELLTKSDGLNKPYGIYFDKKENVLLVCNRLNSKAFIFDVKKRLT